MNHTEIKLKIIRVIEAFENRKTPTKDIEAELYSLNKEDLHKALIELWNQSIISKTSGISSEEEIVKLVKEKSPLFLTLTKAINDDTVWTVINTSPSYHHFISNSKETSSSILSPTNSTVSTPAVEIE